MLRAAIPATLRTTVTTIKSTIMRHISGLAVRRAVESDLDGILDIEGGLPKEEDWIHGTLNNYLTKPHHCAYVATVNGKVISFTGCIITDGGETLIREGGRTLPEYRAIGITAKIMTEILRDTKTVYPKLNSLGWMTETDFGHKYVKERPHTVTVNMIRGQIKIAGNGSQLTQTMERYFGKNIHMESKVEAVSKVQCEDFIPVMTSASSRGLFPGNYFAAACKPFKSITANYKQLTDFADVHMCPDHSLSVSFMHTVPTGIGYIIDLYGDEIDSLRNLVLYHMLKTSRMGLANNQKFFIYYFFTSKDVQMLVSRFLCDELGSCGTVTNLKDGIYASFNGNSFQKSFLSKL